MQSEDICRVCSSPGVYDIFDPIPRYLHASPNDFLHWNKNISILLEETTGLTVIPDDGLPQKMCALCISYLKHAATFRQQAINNAISLIAVKNIISSKENLHIDVTESNLNFKKSRKTDTINYIKDVLSNPKKAEEYRKRLNINNTEIDDINLKMQLDLLFDKETYFKPKKLPSNSSRWNNKENNVSCGMQRDDFSQTHDINSKIELPMGENENSSGEEVEIIKRESNIFNYSEKNFEEDDIMELEILKEANIIINIPEICKERKCRACFRRFMSEESYNEHEKICLELKFVFHIEEVNRLFEIRRNKAISPHEFIRRMIFSLKKTYNSLVDLNVEKPDNEKKNNNSENSLTVLNKDNITVENESKMNVHSRKNSSNFEDENVNETVFAKKNSTKAIDDNNPLLKLLRKKADPSLLIPIVPDTNIFLNDFNTNERQIHTSLLTCSNIEKNIFDNSQKKESEDVTASPCKSPQPSAFISLQGALKKLPKTSTPISTRINFSARCEPCDMVFESVDALENHNKNLHNFKKSVSEKRQNIIAMFEENSNNVEGSINIKNVFN